ncbi:MAG TPA: ATP-binding protein [Nitrososphaeraceae archaeon]|nr:ATP-binding protein [Nitrososphaeraceae archaeon]
MTVELKVHPSFFREFATKTWVSPNEIIKELIENAFDDDATAVLITVLKDGSVVIEDDAGMNADGMEKFLLLGSPHKKYDSTSPRLRRVRTGRYGTGRLSFLTSFQSMKIRTKRDAFQKSILLEASVLDRLFAGITLLNEINEPPLRRNGTELFLTGPKLLVDSLKLSKEIRKLAILRQPLFQVFIKSSDTFTEWDFTGAEAIKAPEIQGHRLGVNLDNGKVIGEIVIAKRPLSDDENGIAIMVGNHIVTRSSFGFDNKLKRVTGFVICDSLTSRFADKSALIEDKEYSKFYQIMQTFITDTVLPSLTEFEDVLITREESKIYKEIDKVLGQAIVENIETEETEGYETVEVKQRETVGEARAGVSLKHPQENVGSAIPSSDVSDKIPSDFGSSIPPDTLIEEGEIFSKTAPDRIVTQDSPDRDQYSHRTDSLPAVTQPSAPYSEIDSIQQQQQQQQPLVVTTRKVRRPILKKTFALRRVGYKVIPYEDESDSRYSFTNENVVFVNKANSTYTAEARRGDEFLLRHIIGIVAEAIAESRHPEGRTALELQNRLVAEAIRIHDNTPNKK